MSSSEICSSLAFYNCTNYTEFAIESFEDHSYTETECLMKCVDSDECVQFEVSDKYATCTLFRSGCVKNGPYDVIDDTFPVYDVITCPGKIYLTLNRLGSCFGTRNSRTY